MPLVLASTSPIRRRMLAAAGVDFTVEAPGVDEAAAKGDGAPAPAIALALACAKAQAVAVRRPEDWVVGSDSTVAIGGERLDKPRDRAEAEQHLRRFSGREMVLTSAVALARGTAIDWRYADQARLQVRPLSDDFIARYLDAEWPEVGYCVGVFRMEGRGVQLFDAIDGDHFTIMGMPLLPLLGALRARGLVPL